MGFSPLLHPNDALVAAMVIAVLGFAEPPGLAQAMANVPTFGAAAELVAITDAGIDSECGAAVSTWTGLARGFFSRVDHDRVVLALEGGHARRLVMFALRIVFVRIISAFVPHVAGHIAAAVPFPSEIPGLCYPVLPATIFDPLVGPWARLDNFA